MEAVINLNSLVLHYSFFRGTIGVFSGETQKISVVRVKVGNIIGNSQNFQKPESSNSLFGKIDKSQYCQPLFRTLKFQEIKTGRKELFVKFLKGFSAKLTPLPALSRHDI